MYSDFNRTISRGTDPKTGQKHVKIVNNRLMYAEEQLF